MYIYICISIYLSPNKRSFRGPGSVVRGLDLQHGAKICAWEVASMVSRGLHGLPWSPVVSRGLPLHALRLIPPKKRSFGGSGGVVSGVDLQNRAKICARELACGLP